MSKNYFRDLMDSLEHDISMESVDCGDIDILESDFTFESMNQNDPMSVVSQTDDVMDDIKDIEDDDLEDLDDAELDKLASDLSVDINDDDIDAIDHMDEVDEVDEVDDLPPLTPAQDAEADDMMNIAATTQIIQNSLTDEQCKKMTESVVELQALVDEGLMTESDMYDMINEDYTTEKSWYANRQRIELGKEARMKQLLSIAVFAEARARNDPDYRKLQKVYKMRSLLRSRLEKKYQAPAKKRVRRYVDRLKKSNNSAVAKIGNNMDK